MPQPYKVKSDSDIKSSCNNSDATKRGSVVAYSNLAQTDKSKVSKLRRSSVFKMFKREPTIQVHDDQDTEMPLICLIDDSPLRIIKVAGKGNLEEFAKLYNADPSRLCIEDSKGQMAIHMAAVKGRINILDFIINHNGDINCKDKKGNTPLHLAVENEQLVVITHLLDKGADPSIKNEILFCPLHLAVDIENIDVVETLVKHPKIDKDVRGDMGATPLHICAFKNRAEAAKLLIRYGAKPCVKCDFGYYPIHCAAKAAASETLEVLIGYAISKGYKREQIMSFKDKENNMPLHSAVHGGNITAVEVCLKAGAPVDTQQDDLSTPLHFAASQGNLEMLMIMYNNQTERFQTALHIGDVVKRTPLHNASLFNHSLVVKFLLEKGADVNAVDSEERTALLLAASKGGWDTVQILLDNSADMSVKDKNNRNFLHLAIKFGGQFKDFKCSYFKNLKNLLNEKDDFGCTPLHYASKEGHLMAIDDLLEMGAAINPKNNHRESPFHFASKYGRFNTCRRLLESEQGPNILNETDAKGMTGLHLAAINGHTKILTLLMTKGAVVNRDNTDNTPLHYAALNGYTQSIRLLLSVHRNLLDSVNIDKDTPLHLAAKAGHTNTVLLLMTLGAAFNVNIEGKSFIDYITEAKLTDVALGVIGHDRWQEVLECCSESYGCPMLGFIQHLPEVCMAVLDRCQTYSNHDGKSAELYIEYNFKYLRCEMTYASDQSKNRDYRPLKPLNTMVQHGRVECLSHPVVVNYLKMKWNSYGMWFYTLYLLVYATYLALLTAFIVQSDSLKHYDKPNVTNTTMEMLHGNKLDGYERHPQFMAYNVVISVYCILNIIKEVFQMITQKKKYFEDPQNFLEWALYLLTLFFLAPFLLGYSFHWQWEIGTLAVFTAWFNCLVFLQRFDFFGIYVVMFLEILKTLIQVICVFSILIIAFGLSFFILLSREQSMAYSTPGLSLFRTVMMMFELDYMESFNSPFTDSSDSTLHYGSLTFFMLALFVLLMPILLMNLLIGLAVGDIEAVQRNARLKRLAMQVDMHSDLERKMPQRLFEVIDKTSYRIYPNKCKSLLINLWSKVTWSGDNDGNACMDPFSKQNTYIYEELFKQKQRIKEVSNTIEKNNNLLKLIVQKMDIYTEDDAWDEGLCPADSFSSIIHPGNNMNNSWRSSSKFNVVRQSAVIRQWKKKMEK
ncbi:hypothetical protein SNE40_004425 [Patella caerulea]|uniref:Ion transport domain-containing protein n=1 Tax=Patella caerulea TaxID=87958 RepID=A0AAN8K4Q2_PATCE